MSRETSKVRADLDDAIDAALPIAGLRVQNALLAVRKELALVDANNAKFDGTATAPSQELGPDPDHACAAHDDDHLGRPCPDRTVTAAGLTKRDVEDRMRQISRTLDPAARDRMYADLERDMGTVPKPPVVDRD